jgi:hypothetical protein
MRQHQRNSLAVWVTENKGYKNSLNFPDDLPRGDKFLLWGEVGVLGTHSISSETALVIIAGLILIFGFGWLIRKTQDNIDINQASQLQANKLMKISSIETKEQYQNFRKLFENLLNSASSDFENDPEDRAAMLEANKQIIYFFDKISQIDIDKELEKYIKTKIKLLSLIERFMEYHWAFIPEESYEELGHTALTLFVTVRRVKYVDGLEEWLYRFYQGIVFSFLYKLSERMKQAKPNKAFLWEFRDIRNDIVIGGFPNSSESKAIERIKSMEDRSDWGSFPKREKEITDEEIEAYMKRRGLS